MPSGYSRSGGNRRRTNRKVVSRNRKKRNLLKPFLALVCLSGICYSVYWILHTPALNVSKARVSGLKLLDRRVVWQDVQPARGKNILSVDTGSLRQRIMKHPEVADVHIKRYPPSTLTVHIIEREPVAVVHCADKFFLIDSSARLLREVESPDTKLPRIHLPSVIFPPLGRLIRSESARSALICLSESKKKNCQIDRISVDQHGNICLNVGSSFFVKLGQPVDISKKLSILRSTIGTKPEMASKVLYFDVSCPERPVLRPRDKAGQEDENAEP